MPDDVDVDVEDIGMTVVIENMKRLRATSLQKEELVCMLVMLNYPLFIGFTSCWFLCTSLGQLNIIGRIIPSSGRIAVGHFGFLAKHPVSLRIWADSFEPILMQQSIPAAPCLYPGNLPFFIMYGKFLAVGTKVEGKCPAIHNESNAVGCEMRHFMHSQSSRSCYSILEFEI